MAAQDGPARTHMQQTILALAAILSFAYLSLGRQRHDIDVERRTLEVETELAATDAAQAQMSAMERLAFDEDDTGATGVRTVPSSSTLGPDAGETGPSSYDDVDDWDGYDGTVSVPVGQGTLQFRLQVSVRYVEDLQPDSLAGTPTLTKQLLVQVDELPTAGTDRAPVQAHLRRVVTPASVATYIHQGS